MRGMGRAAVAAAIAIACAAGSAHADGMTTGTDTLEHFTSTHDGTQQPYRLFVPTGGGTGGEERRPLLVVLHGKGVDQDAWFDFTPVKESAARHGYITAAPHGRGNWFYRGPGEQDVLDTIADVKRRHGVDEDRVFLMGHSMGGWGTWWVGLRHPDLFAGIAPMAGWAPVDLLPAAQALEPFIIHDAGDEIVHPDGSRLAAARLKELGIRHNYREETGYGHGSKLIGDNLPRLFDWMKGRRREARPGAFGVVSRGGAAGKAYGLTIHATDGATATGVLRAVRGEDGALRITAEHVRCLEVSPEAAGGAAVAVEGVGVVEPGVRVAIPAGAECVHGLDREVTAGPLVDVTTTGSSDALTTALARLLMPGTGAEAILLPNDQFWLQAGPLTVRKILDLSVYPDEHLAVLTVTGAELPDLMDYPPYGKLSLFPVGTKVADGERVRVAIPRYVLRKVGREDEAVVLEGTIAARLIEALGSSDERAAAGPKAD